MSEDLIYSENQVSEMAAEVLRQDKNKRDFLINTGVEDFKMTLIPFDIRDKDKKIVMRMQKRLHVGEYGSYPINDYTHGQIASRLEIPMRYYNRMLVDYPELLQHNVNSWFDRKKSDMMVRTLDGTARAFVSKRYRPLDNIDLMQAVIPTFEENKMNIKQSAFTESRLYLKAIFPQMEAEIKKGDIVQAGLIISNSEVGAGALKIEAMIWRLICSNGMITGTSLRKYHVGRGNDNEDDIRQYFCDDTRKADDRAFFLKVRDVCKATARKDVFDNEVDKLKECTQNKLTGNIQKAVEVTGKRFSLLESESESVLHNLINGADLSQYGLANAVTNTAKESNYDRQVELERIGSHIIELPQTDWNAINMN